MDPYPPKHLPPTIKEIKGKSREGTKKGIDIPHTAHIFNLAVLVHLSLSHRHDHARRRFARSRPFVLEVDRDQVGQLEGAATFTPSNGGIA